ncbi:hypothetical protein [Paenibacillus terrae]|uniref:Uncharacterized protein n=1 Tax=Paenibacillus terrae TaxID=159743 RepID=A0A0D7WZ54_9BACL|nr:hypothetical protein [Paenibacillus terrae]KJD44003.1 hypothetical protein QD47_19550 [Paenibacillus terrae]
MDARIAYRMMVELNGVKYLYESTLNGCFLSVCEKVGLNPEGQNRIEVIEKVKSALQVTLQG